MKNLKMTRGILICLCMMLFTGCGAVANTDLQKNTPQAPVTENNGGTKNPDSDDGNALIDSSALQGSVISFSDTGCSVSQVTYEEGGHIATVPAPGNENPDTTVNVKYQTNCEFQIAYINSSTGKATISSASITDIKKQTSLIIYGTFEDTHNLTATRVIIARYE